VQSVIERRASAACDAHKAVTALDAIQQSSMRVELVTRSARMEGVPIAALTSAGTPENFGALDRRVVLAVASAATVLAGVFVLARFGSRGAAPIAPVERARSEDRGAEKSSDAAVPQPNTTSSEEDPRPTSSHALSVALQQQAEVSEVPAPKSRFRGRVVYESNRDPLPWCVVNVQAKGFAMEKRVADRDGRFATAFEYPAGSMRVLVSDEERSVWESPQEFAHAPGSASEVELTVRMWPTLLFNPDPPLLLDPARTICEFGSGPLEHSNHRTRATLRTGPREARFARYGPIFGDGDAMLDALRSSGPPWSVTVFDESTLLRGSAQFERFDGVVDVELDWQQMGALDVAIHVALEGVAPLRNISGTLTAIGTRERRARPTTVSAKLAREAKLEFPSVSPGIYTLSVLSDFCQQVDRQVTIAPGEKVVTEVSLSCEKVVGSIEIEVSSESGEYRENGSRAELEDRSRPFFDSGEVFWTQRGSSWIGRASFRDLPKGNYSVRVMADPYALRPERVASVHPLDHIEFTVLDRAHTVDIGFVVVEAGTNRTIDTFELDVHRLDEYLAHSARSGEIAIEHVPDDHDLAWCISAPGFACARSKMSEASKNWRTDGDRRWVRVELERGFRVDAYVYSREQPGIVGATIVIDGVDAGLTDERGHFGILRSDTPKSVGVRYRDWLVEWSFPEPGQPIHACDEFSFLIAPP
jgi:hypothetical protein